MILARSQAYQGAILITSRSADLTIGQQIAIKKLHNTKDGLRILSQASGRHSLEQDQDALKLLDKLDGLPLALTTAARAYLRQVTITFAEYLELYQKSWLWLQMKAPMLLSYHESLYTTWDLSLSRVRQLNPLSEKLLLLWAYFDNQDNWLEMLQAGRDDEQPDWFRQITEDQLEFGDAMRAVCDHALAEPNPTPPPQNGGSRGYSMHACVHEWTKHVLNEDQLDHGIAKLAFSCLAKHMRSRKTRNFWILRQRLVKHVNECLKIIRGIPSENDDLSMSHGLNALGHFFKDERKFSEAEELYQRALQGREKALGADHLSTLHTVNNLGHLYTRQEKLVKAEETLQRALRGIEKLEVLGPNHISALSIAMSIGIQDMAGVREKP